MTPKIMLLTVILGLLLLPLAAEARVIGVKNNTASHLMELYISSPNTNDWEEDVLSNNVLGPGEVWNIDFHPSYTTVDLLAVFDNGAEHVYQNLNITRTSLITLNANGTANY